MSPERIAFEIVEDNCIDCGICREVCPYTAVFIEPTQLRISFKVDLDRCTGCGGKDHALCVRFCPAPGALVEVVKS